MLNARKYTACLLLIGIFANSLSFWLLSASFSANKNYISSVLCTNKDKPELHCEGKCFMDIKLKELEEKNKHQQENLKRSIETISPLVQHLVINLFEEDLQSSLPFYHEKAPVSICYGIFQPPKIA